MDPTLAAAMTELAPLLDEAAPAVLAAGAVFVRVSAIVWLLPGFGERVIPTRVKLGVALAFAALLWPALLERAPAITADIGSLGVVYAAEATSGVLLGLSARLMVMALQTAGVIAATSLSLTQMFDQGISEQPEPTIATMLTLGGVALAMSLDLHVKVTILMLESYDVLPMGGFPLGSDVAEWTTGRVSAAFSLALSIALPFVVLSFVYNLAIGFINKAMPQMMVSFVGMPFVTWLGLLLVMLMASAAITLWNARLDGVLDAPLGV